MCYKLKSFAKINLYLHIKGKQKDFHKLESVMLLLNLHDEIIIKKSPQNKIILNSKFKEIMPQKDNIITKILNKIEQDFNIKDKFTIHLTKNIPISAGLGGGSSNGGAVLQFLNNYYNLNLTTQYLTKIAYEIGADIPFFFYCNNRGSNNAALISALVQGIGEQITPQDINNIQNYYILLFNPLFPISTAKVFANFTMQNTTSQDIALQTQEKKPFNPKSIEDIIKLGTNTYSNHLEKTIIKLYPQIELYLNTLRQTKTKYSQISGTGATIFAFYKNQEELQQAQTTMQDLFPYGWLYSQKLNSII